MLVKDRLMQVGIKVYKQVAWRYTLLPRSLEVETTKSCNLKCPGCRRNYKKGSLYTEPGEEHLTVEALKRMVDSVPVRMVRFEGDGEPLMNPNFIDLVAFCGGRGIRTMMTSNGTLLDGNIVKRLELMGMVRIHISFDGATKVTHEKTKLGSDFNSTVANCKLIGGSKIQLYMNVVLFSDEIIEELPNFVDLAKSVGATGIHYMKMQQETLDFGKPPDLAKHRGVIRKFNEMTKEAGLVVAGTCADGAVFTECYDPFINPFVILGGDVYACTYMANLRRSEVYMGEEFETPYQNYRMGNIYKQTLRDIWANEHYERLRRFLRATRENNGREMPVTELLRIKKETSDGRFDYCRGCLCRWGESGL